MNLGTIIGLIIILAIFLIVRALFKKLEFTFKTTIAWFKNSLESEGKADAKKITALVLVLAVLIVEASWLKHSYQNDDYSLMLEVLTCNFSFTAICLGLRTTEKVMGTKNPETKP